MGPLLVEGDRVLVQLPAWLGDFVQAEPSVRALCEQEKLAVSLAGDARFLELYDGRFERARRLAHRGLKTIEPSSWVGHDAAVLLSGSFRSAHLAFRARIPRRIGWSRDGRWFLLTHRMRPALERGGKPLGLGVVGRGRRFLPRPFGATCVELLGLVGISVRDTRPRLEATDAADRTARERLARLGFSADEPFLLANVGGREKSAKAYPAQSWAVLLDRLASRVDLPLLLVGGPGEDSAVRDLFARLERTRVAAATGAPVALPELVALCARSCLVLTADSGPRHVAKAAGARVVTLFGPTDPRHGADHLARERAVRVEVPCGPCHLERCPLEGELHHRCMLSIDPEEVALRVLELLE